jgi:prefoldin subunit 5
VVDDADAALKRLNKAIESEYDKLVNAAPAQMESLEARIASLDKRAAEIIRRRAEAKMDRSASEHEAAVRRARELLKGR